MNLTVVLIGLILLFFYKKGPAGIPAWAIKAIGVFLLFMLVRNLNAAYHFALDESDAWWPLVKENAARLTESMRDLIRTMMKGG